MGNKIYAVKNGRNTGIFDSWDECKQQVDGYSGAQYKSFNFLDDANEYLSGGLNNKKETFCDTVNKEMIAYVDGSYEDRLKKFSYAAIMFVNGNRISYMNSSEDPVLVRTRNVSGELLAVCYVMEYCIKHSIKKVQINYDYIGIEYWATKKWAAKNELTQAYVRFMDKCSENIDIVFNKIKSHSGNERNNEVDFLAKVALRNPSKLIQLEVVQELETLHS